MRRALIGLVALLTITFDAYSLRNPATHVLNKYRRSFLLVAINLAVLGAGILVIELLFGGWLKSDNLNRLNLIKDRQIELDVSQLYETDSPLIRYSRDKYGLRGAYGRDPSRIDILTVGGSTTDQHFIADVLTWQNVLQNSFAASGKAVTVANAGIDGQSTIGHIKNFDWWFPYIPQLKPKYILFYVGLNDFHTHPDRSSYDALLRRERHAVVGTIVENSALWHLVRTVRGIYEAKTLSIGHGKVEFSKVRWTGLPLQSDYSFLFPRLKAYRQRLHLLVDKTRELDAEPIFVTQPSRYYRVTPRGLEGQAKVTMTDDRALNGVDYYHMMRRFDATMEAVCSEKRALFVDLAAGPQWEDSDFYDSTHMTPRGARKVGRYLFEKLKLLFNAEQPGAAGAPQSSSNASS